MRAMCHLPLLLTWKCQFGADVQNWRLSLDARLAKQIEVSPSYFFLSKLISLWLCFCFWLQSWKVYLKTWSVVRSASWSSLSSAWLAIGTVLIRALIVLSLSGFALVCDAGFCFLHAPSMMSLIWVSFSKGCVPSWIMLNCETEYNPYLILATQDR